MEKTGNNRVKLEYYYVIYLENKIYLYDNIL